MVKIQTWLDDKAVRYLDITLCDISFITQAVSFSQKKNTQLIHQLFELVHVNILNDL